MGIFTQDGAGTIRGFLPLQLFFNPLKKESGKTDCGEVLIKKPP
jgi:hypothetical protein